MLSDEICQNLFLYMLLWSGVLCHIMFVVSYFALLILCPTGWMY